MALSGSSHYEIRADATANNVNAGGFNPANTNFATDLTTDTNTANTAAPVVSSASYNFAAGDVGHYLFIKAGTNWTPGFYRIASVASNKATLDADVGDVTLWPTNLLNTVAGCATVGTPTSGTYGLDYSRSTSAKLTNTDGAASGTTTFTSAGSTFTAQMKGNFLHITVGGGLSVGWYEIVNFTDANNVVLDRSPGTGTAATFFVGGAMSLGSTLDDDFFEIVTAGGTIWANAAGGTIALGETVQPSTASSGASITSFRGYAAVRGDNPKDDDRPEITTFLFTPFTSWLVMCLRFRRESDAGVGFTATWMFCKFVNTHVTVAGRNAAGTSGGTFYCCEFVAYRGTGVQMDEGMLINCWGHACFSILSVTGSGTYLPMVQGTIFSDFVTAAVNLANNTSSRAQHILNCTIHGTNAQRGTGVLLGAARGGIRLVNSSISGCATGVSHGTAPPNGCGGDFNNYHNNGTDVTNWTKGPNDTAVDPEFANVGQVTGTTGKFDGGANKLIDTSKDFSALGVAVGDYLYVSAGSGVTTLYFVQITAITTTTNPNDTLTTDVSPGTNTTADKVYSIETGHNFAIEGALVGFPGVFPGGFSEGFPQIGAVPQESEVVGGGGGGSIGRSLIGG